MSLTFSDRPPSTTWETVGFSDAPGCHFWVWLKPPLAPQGLALRLPDEVFRTHPQPQGITLRRLLQTTAIDAPVAMWSLYGASYHGMQGLNPALDYPIPPPPPGVDPTIVVMLETAAPPPAPLVEPGARPAAGDAAYNRIEADWNSCLLLEKQLTTARKKLAAMLVRVNGLNRDLTPDEWQHADNRDNADWQDARRWLRDVAARLSRYMKDCDVGFTSAAGQRNLFETTYQQSIVPRRPVAGLEQLQRDFEAYRKTLQTLLNNMQSAQASAERDGEQRAQSLLNRIAVRARAARAKRS